MSFVLTVVMRELINNRYFIDKKNIKTFPQYCIKGVNEILAIRNKSTSLKAIITPESNHLVLPKIFLF